MSSGSKAQKRVIQLYDKNVSTTAHPATMSAAQQVFLQGFVFGDSTISANYWIIDRMSVVDGSDADTVDIKEGSSDNIISRLRMEGNYSGLDIQDGANRNIIQNSYIGNTTIAGVNSDHVCIGLQAYQWGDRNNVVISDTKIIANEFFNCNDAIQFIRKREGDNGSFPGTLIADNDFYITDDRLTDCNGNIQMNGPCMIGENAIDIKGDSDDASRPVHIVNNKMWDFRRSDPLLVPTGSWGDAIGLWFGPKNVVIENNIIADSSRGIDVHTRANNISVLNNLIYGVNFCIVAPISFPFFHPKKS